MPTAKKTITAPLDEERRLRDKLKEREDADARRMLRYLDMPDLSRTPDSPIHEMVERILAIPDFKDFDIIETPEIVPTSVTFDLFDFAPDHPARSKSDTYYVDDKNILRTHTTIMWYYYLQDPVVKARIAAGEAVGSISFGKAYRKDELDRRHSNVFHNIDLWYLSPKKEKTIGLEDLKDVLTKIAASLFGDRPLRFNKDTYPYTDPSLDMEMDKGDGKWLEILGSGVVRGSVLEKLGVDSSMYTGWACGPGLDRLAMISMDLPDIRLLRSDDPRVKKQLHLGQKFEEVSKYPAISRDISFVVKEVFVPNDYFDLIRDIGGDLVEEVELLDTYKDEKKFGKDRVSYTYRIIYRSPERTLTNEEIDPIQKKIYEETARQFNAELR
jgi:phenylalanyl-tRNA synthetase alpha chain